MRDAMLNAVARVVSMVDRSGYRWDEALSFAVVDYGLDEFEAEDLETIARNQYARLQLQMGK
jgi:hypothetical protein